MKGTYAMTSLRPLTLTITSTLALLAAALCLPLAPPAAAQDTVSSATTISGTDDPKSAEIRKELQGYYDEMGESFAQFDVEGATKYFAADYRSVGKSSGKNTRHEMRALYQKLVGHAMRSEMKTEITLCTVKGDTATVQTHMKLRTVLRRDDGVDVLMDADDLSRDFWMKRKGVWQIKQARDFDFTIKRNGELFAQ